MLPLTFNLHLIIIIIIIKVIVRDVKLELFHNRSLNFHNRLLTDDRIDSRHS